MINYSAMQNSEMMTNQTQFTEIYFSADVETDGPIPGIYSMVSFALVACGGRTADGTYRVFDVDDPFNCFYRELTPFGPQSDPEALAISGLTLEHLRDNGEDPSIAMPATDTFVRNVSEGLSGAAKPVFMAYPLSFDWMFVYWYLINFHGESPFGFSSAIDLKTLGSQKLGVGIKKVNKHSLKPFLPRGRKHTHHALDDAREQGLMGMNLLMA